MTLRNLRNNPHGESIGSDSIDLALLIFRSVVKMKIVLAVLAAPNPAASGVNLNTQGDLGVVSVRSLV